jgi:2-phospho-L-lactate/phosphoenolpyruvate guanylyltransferase
MKALLIPVKDPANAKTRLSGLLTLDERRKLAWSMFEDVCDAVRLARSPDRIVMVTNHPRARDRARDFGWDVLEEEGQTSESESVDWASRQLAEQGFDTVMRLPADLPTIRAEDIEAILSIDLLKPGAVLVPSMDGTGTNAIMRRPATIFRSRFGPNSLALHKQEAAKAGFECMIVNNARIALDVDEPSDLERLLEQAHINRTLDALNEMNVRERLLNLYRERSTRDRQN